MKVLSVFFFLFSATFGGKLPILPGYSSVSTSVNATGSDNSTQLPLAFPTVQRESRYLWDSGPPASAHQESHSKAGAFGSAKSSGIAKAHNEGGGSADATQISTSFSGVGGSSKSSGIAIATSGSRFRRNSNKPPKCVIPEESRKNQSHEGGTAISKQESKVSTGKDGTAIGHGSSSAKGNANGGGAVSEQKTTASGGAGSTVVADGSSESTINKRSVKAQESLSSNVRSTVGRSKCPTRNPGDAVSHQDSHVNVGKSSTGIGNGQSSADNSGGGSAISKQTTTADGGKNSIVVADGKSTSVVHRRSIPDNSPRNNYRNSGDAISHQESHVNVGKESTGIGNGQSSAANSGGGSAISKQTTTTSGGKNSIVVADGKSTAVVSARYKRDAQVIPSSSAPDGSAQITAGLQNAMNTFLAATVDNALKNPKTIIATSSVSASNK